MINKHLLKKEPTYFKKVSEKWPEELKPCPFCGDADIEIIESSEYYDEFEVQCQECGARSDWENTRRKVVADWNKRVKP